MLINGFNSNDQSISLLAKKAEERRVKRTVKRREERIWRRVEAMAY